MNIYPSLWAVDSIKEDEGLMLKAYLCPAGKWTIGYGHTGADVHEGMVITGEQADSILSNDLRKVSDNIKSLGIPNMTQGQLDALCSFVFNLGIGALKASTLLKKMYFKDIKGAAEEFRKWDKAHVRGRLVVLPGLTKRRAKEKERFLS